MSQALKCNIIAFDVKNDVQVFMFLLLLPKKVGYCMGHKGLKITTQSQINKNIQDW